MLVFNSEMFIDKLTYLLNKDKRRKGLFYDAVVASGVVAGWKKRGTAPQADKLLKIAQYFDVTIDYLLGLSDDPKGSGTFNPETINLPDSLHKLTLRSPSALDPNPDLSLFRQQVTRIYNKGDNESIARLRGFLAALDPGYIIGTFGDDEN